MKRQVIINKQKLKRKTVQHMFIATTRVYFTQCALLFVRHTMQVGVEVSPLVGILRLLCHGD